IMNRADGQHVFANRIIRLEFCFGRELVNDSVAVFGRLRVRLAGLRDVIRQLHGQANDVEGSGPVGHGLKFVRLTGFENRRPGALAVSLHSVLPQDGRSVAQDFGVLESSCSNGIQRSSFSKSAKACSCISRGNRWGQSGWWTCNRSEAL